MTNTTPTAPQDALSETSLQKVIRLAKRVSKTSYLNPDTKLEDLEHPKPPGAPCITIRYETVRDLHAALLEYESAPPVTQAANAEKAGESVGMEARRIIQGFLDCPEIYECAPEDKEGSTHQLESGARKLLRTIGNDQTAKEILAEENNGSEILESENGTIFVQQHIAEKAINRALLRTSDGWNRDMSKAPRDGK